MAKSWATWFEQRAKVRRMEGMPYIDPVLIALHKDVERYMRQRAAERASRVAVDLVRAHAPLIVDARDSTHT